MAKKKTTAKKATKPGRPTQEATMLNVRAANRRLALLAAGLSAMNVAVMDINERLTHLEQLVSMGRRA